MQPPQENDLRPHPHVTHPTHMVRQAKESWLARQTWLVGSNDKILDWLSDHVLASMLMFDIALIVPLIALAMSTDIKVTLGVISGSWIQWWALPALQRSQVKTQAQNEAKAEVDHETLTYLAKLQDEQMTELKGIAEILRNLKNK